LTETEPETARAGTQAGGVREGEAGFPLSREPNRVHSYSAPLPPHFGMMCGLLLVRIEVR